MFLYFLNSTIGICQAAEINDQTDEENKLTYQQAYEMALASSSDIKKIEGEIEKSWISKEEASDEVSFIPLEGDNSNTSAVSTYKSAVKAEINYQIDSKNIQVEKDKLYYSVVKAYNSVLSNQKAYQIAEKDLEIASLEKKINEIRYNLGTISTLDKLAAEQAYQEKEDNYNSAKIALQESYEELNSLLGIDREARLELVEEPVYQEAEITLEDVKVIVSRVTANSIPVWIQEQYVKLAQLELSYYAGSSYESKEIDYDQSVRELSDTKKSLEESIYDVYYQIQELEDTIERLNEEKTQLETEANIAETKYQLGTGSKMDLLTSQLAVMETEANIFANIVKHNELQEVLYKPWING